MKKRQTTVLRELTRDHVTCQSKQLPWCARCYRHTQSGLAGFMTGVLVSYEQGCVRAVGGTNTGGAYFLFLLFPSNRPSKTQVCFRSQEGAQSARVSTVSGAQSAQSAQSARSTVSSASQSAYLGHVVSRFVCVRASHDAWL
jgi:hypothetical protein